MSDVASITSLRKHILVSLLASPSCAGAQGVCIPGKGLGVLMQDGLVARLGRAHIGRLCVGQQALFASGTEVKRKGCLLQWKLCAEGACTVQACLYRAWKNIMCVCIICTEAIHINIWGHIILYMCTVILACIASLNQIRAQ